MDTTKFLNGRYCNCEFNERLYNDTLNVIITLITIIPKYYFNQHYNKADNKDSKQNEREIQRTFCLELIRYV